MNCSSEAQAGASAISRSLFFAITRFIERGDLIGVSGHVFRTKLGELTIWVDQIDLLAKALLSLPEKFHGLTNVEKRYRQRYVDLIVNEESRKNFRTRSRVISLLRTYLTDREFLEFETPILQPVYGGANAKQSHAKDEHAYIPDVLETALEYAAFFMDWCGRG